MAFALYTFILSEPVTVGSVDSVSYIIIP